MYSNRPEVKTFQITPFKITNILNVPRRQHYETMGNMPEASNVGIPGILTLKLYSMSHLGIKHYRHVYHFSKLLDYINK
jgi:hypothetical protein